METTSKWYGDTGPFETITREEVWAENKTGTFTVLGKYKDLIAQNIKPGDILSNVRGLEAPSGNWYVRSATVSREEGDSGSMTINAVRVIQMNDGKPYNMIWQSSMEAVEKKLISHPKVKKSVAIIQKWEETPALYKYGDGEDDFRYIVDGSMIGDIPKTEKITDQAAIDYCKAVKAGITTYNVYLPVVTKTTYYLELPGCYYDKDHVVKSGTIKLSEAGLIGTWDTPDIRVSCVSNTKGAWLKSMDSITENADGTCTRTEQWTYTNDEGHKWIYEE